MTDKKPKYDRDNVDVLDSYIEYAEATKKFSDAGCYQRVKEEVVDLRSRLEDLQGERDILSKSMAEIQWLATRPIVPSTTNKMVEMITNFIHDKNYYHSKVTPFNVDTMPIENCFNCNSKPYQKLMGAKFLLKCPHPKCNVEHEYSAVDDPKFVQDDWAYKMKHKVARCH